jgi:hypothetical protein
VGAAAALFKELAHMQRRSADFMIQASMRIDSELLQTPQPVRPSAVLVNCVY